MKRLIVELEFLADDDVDQEAFGEDVLCAVERSPDFFTDGEGLLRLAPAPEQAVEAEIDALRAALRHLNEWCPSRAPRQAEIDRLLATPRLPMRSLLQLRARIEMSSIAAFMDQTVVDD